MNTTNFWWIIISFILVTLLSVRLIIQFRKTGVRELGFLALSYLPLVVMMFKRVFWYVEDWNYGVFQIEGALVSLSAFSALSFFVLILVPNAQERMGTLFRFPIAGVLLGGYVGEDYAWLSFVLAHIVLCYLFYTRTKDFPRIFKLQLVVCGTLFLSYFFKFDQFYLSSIFFCFYLLTAFKIYSISLVSLLFKRQEAL